VAALKKSNITRIINNSCIAHNIHLFIAHNVGKNQRFSTFTVVIMKLKVIFRTIRYKYDELKNIHQAQQLGGFFEMLDESVDHGKQLNWFEKFEKYFDFF
jgi:hypothetical protein